MRRIGSDTLADYPGGVRIECPTCGRPARYRLESLIDGMARMRPCVVAAVAGTPAGTASAGGVGRGIRIDGAGLLFPVNRRAVDVVKPNRTTIALDATRGVSCVS
jgi:hypothetical protein